MKNRLSIVIPAYNEQERLGDSIHEILQFVENKKLDAEVIVVDDGSTDATKAAAVEVCGQFPLIDTQVIRYEENRGKGFAVKTGFHNSNGDIAMFTDADLSTPIAELYKIIEPIESGEFDVTFGSRALDRSLIGVRQPWLREQSGKVFNLIVRSFTGLPFWDTQCGFKAFNMKKFRPFLNLMQIERFGFDVELLYVANLHKLNLKEIPVRWDNDERTTVNALRDSRRMFNEVRQIRRNGKLGAYEEESCAENITEFVEVVN